MTHYDKSLNVPFVLTREPLNNILGYVCQELNWKNLRVAETEKYAHVTYFFNGGVEKPFGGEEREMVASPKVATYDLKPEMSADGVTEKVLDAMGRKDFDVIVMNFANADMVGHSGQNGADRQGGRKSGRVPRPHLAAAQREKRPLGHHRRSRQRRNHDRPDHQRPHTYHTTNPVPFILVDDSGDKLRPGGALQDIAPTILGVLGRSNPRI